MSVYPQVPSQVVVPKTTPSGSLFVYVGGTWGNHQKSSITGQRVSLEDCARGYWNQANLSQARAEECDYLIAHYDGKICGVWKIDRKKGWMTSAQLKKSTWPEDYRTNSLACDLIPVDDPELEGLKGQSVHLGRSLNPLRGYFTI